MSGIAACLVADGRPAPLERMLEALSHRGPDGADSVHAGPVALGHLLLATTPEDRHASLPRTEGPVVVTADVRIDNRQAVLAAVDSPTAAPDGTVTDGALVAAAYQKWGLEAPEHLVGAFAFALWDRDERRLVCARDHAGIKPLYYHAGDGAFFAASEIGGLRCLEAVPEEVDEVRVGQYLVGHLEDRQRTFYRAIRRLPAGHVVVVDADDPGAPDIRRYWRLDPDRQIRLESDAAYAAAFRERFREAVACRLRTAHPVGTMLSGGLDSSSIACVARELTGDDDPLPAVSAAFEAVPECDEREYRQAVLDGGGFESHVVRPDQVGPLVDLETVLGIHGEPFYVPNHFIHWLLHREAAAQGVRVLLDGVDGDTTVSHGRGYLAELARRGRFLRLYRELSGYAERFDQSRRYTAFRLVAQPLAPAPLRRWYRRVRGHEGHARTENPALDPAFVERIGLEDRVRRARHEQPARATSERERHYRKLAHGLNQFVLEVQDRIGAHFGVEPRYPFFDRRLMEFCLALPPDQKIRRGWTRYVLRQAMSGILPEAVRTREDKSNLAPNFYRGLRVHDRDRLEGLLDDDALLRPYLVPAVVRDRSDAFLDGSTDAGMTVWRAATLAAWRDRSSRT